MDADCTLCKKQEKRDHHELYKIVLHTCAVFVCRPKKSKRKDQCKKASKCGLKPNRDNFVRKLKQWTCALRNSGGGAVLVHISDLDPEDRCLDLFHQLVDERLNDMIEDGSLFVTTYKKDWLAEDGDDRDFVEIIVPPSVSVVTLDYKTKLPLDSSIVEPSSVTILKFLTEDIKPVKSKPEFLGLGFEQLQESRHVQVKALLDKNDILTNVDTLVNYIWNDLRLREYVTSISKIDGGGSVFFGIQEQEKEYEQYSSKCLIRDGFKVDFSQTEIIDKLKALVKQETIVFVAEANQGKFVKEDNLIDATFHSIEDKAGYYVLEVAVGSVAGLVFYDALGPEAYEIDEKRQINRIDCDDWYQRQTNQLKKQFAETK